MINAQEVLQAQLARGLGLDRYADIMRGDPASPDFQRAFNGYYRIRRNEEWRRYYYDLFAKAKTEHYSFEQIITELYRITGNVEASFSSKMLALQNLGLELMGKTQEEKLQNAVILYDQIVNWYTDYLTTDEARESIMEFDRLLPEYAWVSETKKIDCLLWSKRG